MDELKELKAVYGDLMLKQEMIHNQIQEVKKRIIELIQKQQSPKVEAQTDGPSERPT